MVEAIAPIIQRGSTTHELLLPKQHQEMDLGFNNITARLNFPQTLIWLLDLGDINVAVMQSILKGQMKGTSNEQIISTWK